MSAERGLPADSSVGPHDAFLGLPVGVGADAREAWQAFASDPVRSRAAARRACDGGSSPGSGWGALCLAYHAARAGDVAAAEAALRIGREQLRDPRGAGLAEIAEGYVQIARGEPERAIATLEAALATGTESGHAAALDRFLACHALALAHGRQGRLEQVLDHHYTNILLLERYDAPAPLAVVLLNLSSALTSIDEWQEALELARRALACCEHANNAALRRRAQINEALALRFLGRIDEAVGLLERLRAEPYRDPGSDFALYLNSAEALAQLGRAGEARACLDLARAAAVPTGDAHEQANLAWVDGLISARSGRVDEAVRKLEEARAAVLALRKLHVPLLPRIVEVLASCYAQAGDLARAFETYQRFHEAYEARLGYTTRARYRGLQSRAGAAAVARALESGDPSDAWGEGDGARLGEALRRTLVAAGRGSEPLAGWREPGIARMGAEASGLGVSAERVDGVVSELARAAPAASQESSARVHIRVLGRFEVQVGGQPLRFGRKRPERPLALLKFLAAHGPHGVPETAAADALWPDLEGDAGLRALAVNLHRLRQLLGGGDAVAHTGRRLALDTATVWCDATRFEELLDRASASPDPERERWTTLAVAIYRGDLDVDEDRERWAINARDRLRSRFLRACAGQGARLAAAGRWDEARASYARALDLDPTAEESCLGFMRCALALGLPQEGLDACGRLERGLFARRQAASGAIRALYQELLANAGRSAPPPQSVSDP